MTTTAFKSALDNFEMADIVTFYFNDGTTYDLLKENNAQGDMLDDYTFEVLDSRGHDFIDITTIKRISIK